MSSPRKTSSHNLSDDQVLAQRRLANATRRANDNGQTLPCLGRALSFDGQPGTRTNVETAALCDSCPVYDECNALRASGAVGDGLIMAGQKVGRRRVG